MCKNTPEQSRRARDNWAIVRSKMAALGYFGNRERGTKILDSAYWPEFFDEKHKATVGPGNVAYLNEKGRSVHKAGFEDNKLKIPPMSVFKISISQSTRGQVIYAVDAAYNFYVGIKDIHSENRFHHSSFLAGRPVATAGTMVLEPGFQIVEVNNHSGHYKPGLPELRIAARAISLNGGDISKIPFKFSGGAGVGEQVFASGNELLA